MAEISKDGTVTSSATEIFETPANAVTIFSSLSGYAATDETVTVYLDNGGAAAATTNIIDVITAEAGVTWFSPAVTAKRLAQGGKLYIKTASGTTNWFLSGRTTPQNANAETVG